MTNYYVSTVGNNSNNGLSKESAWRTITYAATKTVAGDLVKIKGGNYGHEHVVFSNSGISGNPITYQGYDGDVIMDGSDSTGYGLYINNKEYITINGFKITKYQFAILGMNAKNCIINNNIVYLNYKGVSFQGGGGNNNIITNIEAYNNDMVGIEIFNQSNCWVENCLSYNKKGLGSYSDYGYSISTNSKNNTIINCISGLPAVEGGYKVGHGYSIRHKSYNNKIINCNSYFTGNEHFKVSEDSENNQFINCIGIGADESVYTWGIALKSSNNIVSNCILKGMTYGLLITVSATETISTPIQGNVIQNSVFVNNKCGIFYLENGNPADIKNNIIKNSIISYNTDGIRINALIDNILKYNDVWGNTINYVSSSAGVGDISVDPLFADYINNDFHLKSQYGRWNGNKWVTDGVTSPCIDAGDPNDDYNNELLPNGGRINIGAYGNTEEASLSNYPEFITPTVTNIIFTPEEITDKMEWSAIVTIENKNDFNVENVNIVFYYNETPENIFYTIENIIIPTLSSINIEENFGIISAGEYNICCKVVGE